MKNLTDRVAVVTGAAGGIGRAMVESFLDAELKVVLADIDIQECTVGEIQKHRVSRNQYPGSVRTGKGFRRDGLDRI